jgi:hypothetical protein
MCRHRLCILSLFPKGLISLSFFRLVVFAMAHNLFVLVGRLGFFRRNIIVFMLVGEKGGEGWGKSWYGPGT